MAMMNISHFLLTPGGEIAEVTPEQAAAVAAGEGTLPEFADARLRYLQVIVDDKTEDEDSIQVRTAGALIHLDADGRLQEAGMAMGGDNAISSFEHDTCVQLALHEVAYEPITRH